jgi:hypothetical protein
MLARAQRGRMPSVLTLTLNLVAAIGAYTSAVYFPDRAPPISELQSAGALPGPPAPRQGSSPLGSRQVPQRLQLAVSLLCGQPFRHD